MRIFRTLCTYFFNEEMKNNVLTSMVVLLGIFLNDYIYMHQIFGLWSGQDHYLAFLKHNPFTCVRRESYSWIHRIWNPTISRRFYHWSKVARTCLHTFYSQDSLRIEYMKNTNHYSFWWGYANTNLHYQIFGLKRGNPGIIVWFLSVYTWPCVIGLLLIFRFSMGYCLHVNIVNMRLLRGFLVWWGFMICHIL